MGYLDPGTVEEQQLIAPINGEAVSALADWASL
jgi:hypothetical protein